MTRLEQDDSITQERVFAFLADPTTHPHVQRIDTHAASVFLDGTRALKIKRAVRFPFLDYSTLEKRKTACEDEIRINRPFAPQIYRRVIAITQSADGLLHLDGGGTVVEYAVEMTRFDERKTLDHLAEAGPLVSGLVNATADAIAASHEVAPRVAGGPWIASIAELIEGNSTALRAANHFPAADIDDLDAASQSAFAQVRSLLERRGEQGFVRRCHGDLHLANIVVIDEKPILFDAIEFDETIASVDVLYDLAFPVMDLLRYGQRAAANGLLNRYLAITPPENLDALAALPLLMSIRAAIRSKALLARLGRGGADEADLIRAARRYFDLSRALIHPPGPALIAIGGLSGTGKSLQARAIAPSVPPSPGAIVVRSDVLRKQFCGVGETDPLPAAAYEPDVTERIYQTLEQRAAQILSQGHSVIIDAVYAREDERNSIRETARKSGIRLIGLFLVADLATRQSRVASRKNDASDATPEVARLQEAYDIGPVDWTVIDASGPPDAVLGQCRAAIGEVVPEPEYRRKAL